MKILIVLVRWKGGVGRVVSSIKPLIEKKGHYVEVISREDDLKCFSLKQSFFKLRKEVKKRDYDILYTMDWSCALALLGFKNHSCGFMGLEKKSPFLQNFVGFVMGSKLFVLADPLKKKYPKATLIYPGVDKSIFKNLRKKRIKNSVGFVNWINKKEYHYDKVKRVAKELGLDLREDDMKLSRKDLVDFLNSVEMLVTVPTGSPGALGWNLTLLEAMACGVPKIVSTLGKDFNINYVENLNNLKDVMKNAKATKYKIPQEFDWNIHTNKLLEVFSKKENGGWLRNVKNK